MLYPIELAARELRILPLTTGFAKGGPGRAVHPDDPHTGRPGPAPKSVANGPSPNQHGERPPSACACVAHAATISSLMLTMDRLKLLSCQLAIAFACSQAIAAAETVTVQTLDGRDLRGVVDARTDDERLWLRQEQAGVSLAVSLSWSDVESAALDGNAIETSALRERAAELASIAPRWSAGPATADTGAAPLKHAPLAIARQPAVRSVEIVGACLVNLDRDIEPDGLLLSVAAINDRGQPVPVRGSLAVRLIGEHRPAAVYDVTFDELDRWSQPVSPRDFVDGIATYELRFRRTAPEWQFDLMPDAVLDLTLGAFGEGDFAAAAPVVLRQLNPLRDERQLLTGTRFIPGELAGRNPLSARFVATAAGLPGRTRRRRDPRRAAPPGDVLRWARAPRPHQRARARPRAGRRPRAFR